MSPEPFGVRLERLMAERGWTQDVLARRSKVSRVSIWHYRKGTAFPGFWNLIEIANALDVSLDYICFGEQQ